MNTEFLRRNQAVGCCLVGVGRAVSSAPLREFGKSDGDPVQNNELVPTVWIDWELRNGGLETARPTKATATFQFSTP